MRQLVILSFLFFGFIPSLMSQQNSEKSKYGLLWEISGNGLEKNSYLFGTMHVRDMRAFEFPDTLLIALDNCEAMATEVHFDSLFTELWNSGMKDRIRREIYDLDDETQPMESWLDKLSNDSEEFTPPPPPPPRPSVSNRSRFKKSRKEVTNSKFDLLDLMFSNSKELELADEFLDAYLFQRAKNLGKDLYGLEEVKTQLDLRKTDYSIDTTMVDSLLRGPVPSIDIKIDELYGNQELLLEIYQQGNLSKVREFSRIFYGVNSQDRKDWLLNRNEVMLNSMIEIMHQKSLFSAVGCAHLPDQGGLLELLRNAGYSVRKVTPSFTGVAEEKMKMKLENLWISFEDTKAGYSLQLPKKPEKMDVMAGFEGWLCGDLVNNLMIINYGTPCAYAGFDPDDPEIYDKLIQKLKDQGRVSSIKNKREVIRSGVKGIETEIFISSSGISQQGKLWLFSKEEYIYVIMALSTNNERLKFGHRLLNSIVFFPREKSEEIGDFKTEASEGFSAMMPGVYASSEIFLVTDYSEPEFKMRQAQFVASDISDNSVRMIIRSDVAPGQYFDNDSLALSSIFEDPAEATKYGAEYGKKFKLENGIVGYQPNKLGYDRDVAYIMRGYLRGPSMYLALYQQSKEDFEMKKAIDFFQSIEFLSLHKDDMFIHDQEEVHVPVVNTPLESDLSNAYGNDEMEFHLNDFFSASNISFSFYKEPESKYAVQESLDSLYAQHSEQKSWFSDLARDTVITNAQGDKYVDIISPTEGSNCVEREVMFYKNDAYYTFIYHFPVELLSTPWFLELPNEIIIDDIDSLTSPEAKRNLFFHDILSEDKERFLEAKNFLYQMDFELGDSLELKKMLYRNFDFADSDETYIEHTHWMHNQAVEKLIGLNDESVKPMLLEFFEKETLPGVKTSTYFELKKKDWTETTLAEMIIAGDSLDSYSYNYTQIFNEEIKDSLDLFIQNLATYTTAFNLDIDGIGGVLGSLNQSWDTLENNGFQQDQIIPIIEKWLINAKDSLILAKKEERSYWEYENLITASTMLLSKCDLSQNHDLITSLKIKDLELNPSSFLIYKMRHGLAISDLEWEYAKEYEWGLFDVLLQFHNSEKSKLLPKDLRSKETLVETAFVEIIQEDWGEIEILEHLGTKKIKVEGTQKPFLFILFKDNYDPDLSYVGAIEILDLDNLSDINHVWELDYNYTYDQVVKGDYKTRMNDIIKMYEN